MKKLLRKTKDEREARIITKAFVKETKGTESLADATFLARKRRLNGLTVSCDVNDLKRLLMLVQSAKNIKAR